MQIHTSKRSGCFNGPRLPILNLGGSDSVYRLPSSSNVKLILQCANSGEPHVACSCERRCVCHGTGTSAGPEKSVLHAQLKMQFSA